MSKIWYYADRSGQQQGPVDAIFLQQAVKQGSLDAETLVWRDGLPEWQPLRRHAADLGLGLQSPPPLPSGAHDARPRVIAPARSSSAAWLVIGLVVLVGGLAFIGILAAIAIPAYADYTLRAKVSAALAEAAPLRAAIEAAVHDGRPCPSNGVGDVKPAAAYAGPQVERIDVGALEDSADCAIQVHFRDLGAGSPPGKHHVLLVREASGRWRSETSLPQRYLPAALRESRQVDP